MELIIHKGAHSIGGGVIEIKTKEARIFFDFGSDLPSAETERLPLEIEGLTQGEKNCDAVFFSHYHSDHTGEYERILPGIPIYMGKVSKEIFSLTQKRQRNSNHERIDNFKAFKAGDEIVIKDIKIYPHSVDHSAFDSYALLIEAEGKRILYTGDYRMHGPRGGKMTYMLEKYCSNIDLLITEGTTLTRDEDIIDFNQFKEKANCLIEKNKNTFVLCSSTDIDSIASFYEVSINQKKPFIISDEYQREILDTITKNSRSDFYNFDRKKIYSYPIGQKLQEYMDDKGFVFFIRANSKYKDFSKNYPGSTLIYSMWDGYLNEENPSFLPPVAVFLKESEANGLAIEYLHTSGHAKKEDIKKVINITKPKVIIPIHGDNPEAFEDIKEDSILCIPKDGELISF